MNNSCKTKLVSKRHGKWILLQMFYVVIVFRVLSWQLLKTKFLVPF